MSNAELLSTNIQISLVLDAIYNFNTEESAQHIEIGIWDWNEPYTYYAVVKNNNGSTAYGESSYDSQSVADAIQCLVNELYT